MTEVNSENNQIDIVPIKMVSQTCIHTCTASNFDKMVMTLLTTSSPDYKNISMVKKEKNSSLPELYPPPNPSSLYPPPPPGPKSREYGPVLYIRTK